MSCPSELGLDRFEHGEARELGAHVEGCAACQSRLTARREAYAAIDAAAHVRAVHLRLAEPPRRRWRFLLALAPVAAALLIAVQPSQDGLRSKGAVSLSVFKERAGTVSRAESGEPFAPGDKLRFRLDLAADAEVMILGVEASGRVYDVFPATQDNLRSSPVAAGAERVLPGAVELDASIGREVLHLVACPRPFARAEVEVGAEGVEVPAGCVSRPFVLEKSP